MAKGSKRVEFPISATENWLPAGAPKDSGQSTTYFVRHKSSGRDGVLKIAHLSPSQRARLKREITLLADFSHPAIAEALFAVRRPMALHDK